MALVSGEQEYSPPAKRLKLDQTPHLSNSNVELDFGAFSAPLKNVHGVIKGQYSLNSELLNNDDSLLNDLPSTSCDDDGQSGPSLVATASIHSSSHHEDDEDSDRVHKDQEEEEEEDEKDEVSSIVSNLSEFSGLSDLSGQEWKPISNSISWVQKQIITGVNPRTVLNQCIGFTSRIPPTMDDITLWKIIVNMLSEPPRRQKLRHVNTLIDVVRLLKGAKKIIVLTGAGVSVSCGIPDFRSRDGIYSRLALDFPDLPDPQAMFDIQYFSKDPRPFFKFAREIYPGQFKPSPCHRFIKMLERHNKLLRNYTQNIDTLEQVAGIQNVIECHGSFATASCTRCKYRVTADAIRDDIFAQRIPLCPQCTDNSLPHTIDSECISDEYRDLVERGIMKPDIVFFGEGLPDQFHDSMAADKDECDLLIVIGSSLKVRPVALIPSSIPANVPQILINREPLPHFNFDVKLLGDSDVIINQLCHMLGSDWKEACWCPDPLMETKHLLPSSYSRRNRSDDIWGNHYNLSVHVPPDCSRDGLNIECTTQMIPSSKDTEGSCSPYHVDHGSNVESSEADSLQMSIDSGMGMSADSSCCILKERHMSVDSSTRDSGICFSADSPTDNTGRNFNIIDSSRDCSQDSTDNHSDRESSLCGISSSRDDNDVDSTLRHSPADSTSLGKQYAVLIDSSTVLTEAGSSTEYTKVLGPVLSVSADSSSGVGGVTSSENTCVSIRLRQKSMDSTRDSGIGDSTNSVDSTASCSAESISKRYTTVNSNDDPPKCEEDLDELRASWQPKIRESLAVRLPENCYYFMQPNTYIFPGAEVFCDPEDSERSAYSGSSSSDCSDTGSNVSDDSDGEEVESSWDTASTPTEMPVKSP